MCILVGVLIKWLYEIHGATVKTVNAQNAKLNNNYKNTKLNLLKANAAVWFNKMCKIKRLKSDFKCFNVKNFYVSALVSMLIKWLYEMHCNDKYNY